MTGRAKKTTTLARSVSLAMLLSYVESFVPMPLPGIKLGLANAVTLFLLYTYGAPYAIGVAVVRIFLSTLLFGAFPTAIIYSFAGAALSLLVMLFSRWVLPFGKVGVSVLGSVFHNLGQTVAACLIMRTAELAVYIISGIIIEKVGKRLKE